MTRQTYLKWPGRIGICLFFCTWALTAQSHEHLLKTPAHPLDRQLDQCFKANPGTTSERHCIETLIPRWQERLNDYYRRLGGDQNALLKNSQTAWVQYAQAQEAYFREKYNLPGTMYALFFAEARLQLLRHRVLQLESDLLFLEEHR